MGLALLAGLAYLIRRRPKTSNGMDGIKTHSENRNDMDVNQNITREIYEVSGDGMPAQLPEQGLVELQHLREHSELGTDGGIR